MKILICGSGIAGLTLAFWLQRQNHELTIVEKSPALRTEGYMIDFFGSGYDAAERMQILGDLSAIHYPISGLVFLEPDGREKFSVSYPVFRKIFDDRHFNFMRGELEQVLRAKLPAEVAIKFETSVRWLQHEDNQVKVELTNGEIEKFDLVVGADGIHSKVRELTFGKEREFKRFLGCYTAAFIIDRPPDSFDLGNAFYTMTVPRKQLGVYPIRGDRVATYFIYNADRVIEDFSSASARAELARVFGDL
jgi:2-polyprenyl-6-methoxyphenol hydroxylase-like FAD-dependent oxidoreductase